MILEALAGSGSQRRSAVVMVVAVAASWSVMRGNTSASGAAQKPAIAAQNRADGEPQPADDELCVQRFLQSFRDIAPHLPADLKPEPAPEPAPQPEPEPEPEPLTASSSLQVTVNALNALVLPAAPPALAKPEPGPPVVWARELDETVVALENVLGAGGKLEAHIAMVADPIDSGFSYQFDTQLQALRLGFEQQLGNFEQERPVQEAYYRDRTWLPWDDRAVSGEQQAASQECRKSTPGVLLFRGNDQEEPRLLAVLLVGESPTSGVHARALERALEVAERFASSDLGRSKRLEITGPTFSGSTQSMKRALLSWSRLSSETRAAAAESRSPESDARHTASFPPDGSATDAVPLREIQIRTGSATGPMVAAQLRGPPGESWLPGHQVSFSATTPPESAVQCGYLMYLRCRLGVGRGYFEGCALERPERLAEVALLHESGTEFGANFDSERSDWENRCKLGPGLDLTFPVHIEALRDAYEEADRHGIAPAEMIGRRTQLAASLREKPPLDLDSEPSARTTFALDVALTNVLDTISLASVRHVGIQATDIGDAIFLARKIRDVSPDVRIAFFTSDVLLLHSEYARDLEGSLVVSAYPFLGTNSLAPERPSGWPWFSKMPQHNGFANATSLAVFNAVLASRGAAVHDLREYVFSSEHEVLPIWISAIGSGAFVPVSMGPSRDGDRTIDLGKRRDSSAAKGSAGGFGAGPRAPYDERRRALRQSRLTAADNASIPRLWHVVFAFVSLAWAADWFMRRRSLATLSRLPAPRSLDPTSDHAADLAMSRTKWRLYGWIRSVVLAGAVLYMGTLYLVAYRVYPAFDVPALVALIIAAVVLGALTTARRAYVAFRRDYRDLVLRGTPRWRLAWWVRARAGTPHPGSVGAAATSQLRHRGQPVEADGAAFWSGAVQLLGFARPLDRRLAALTSVAQLRALKLIAWTLIALFAFGQLSAVFDEWSLSEAIEGKSTPAATLWVLRSMVIVGAASPAAPTLLCALIVYVWAAGRMARLRLVHGLSRMAPPQAALDLVATPLCAVLYPAQEGKPVRDDGFGRVERGVVNAILRPITGAHYATALAMFAFAPIVPFMLKPPSTLERDTGTVLLAAGLALSALLIGSTLIQLVQYWLALEFMLKRITQHRLGECFVRVDPLVRDSADEQLSRAPSDVLRLATCQERFDALVRETQRLGPAVFGVADFGGLEKLNAHLLELRRCAVSTAIERPVAEAALRESALGRGVIEAGAAVMVLLGGVWDRERRSGTGQSPHRDARSALTPSGDGAPPADAVASDTPNHGAHGPGDPESSWRKHAEELAATVTAFLVNRHVRQLPHFVSTLIACALLSLLTLQSYPFEPHRLLFTCLWTLVAAVVVTALWVYFSVQKNALLSMIAGTLPGKVTWDGALILRVLAWGILPVLGMAAAQYPDVANALLKVVEPFTRALK